MAWAFAMLFFRTVRLVYSAGFFEAQGLVLSLSATESMGCCVVVCVSTRVWKKIQIHHVLAGVRGWRQLETSRKHQHIRSGRHEQQLRQRQERLRRRLANRHASRFNVDGADSASAS
eukprot:scaffold13285_cov36-Cyclotella_meneghiniana.AAC.6